MPSPLNNPASYAVWEDGDPVIQYEQKCKCGGHFTVETYTPKGSQAREHRVTHSLPVCQHFEEMTTIQYLIWNAQKGKPN